MTKNKEKVIAGGEPVWKNVLSINNLTGIREIIILQTKVDYTSTWFSEMDDHEWLICRKKNRQTTIVNIDKIGWQTIMFRINLIK